MSAPTRSRKPNRDSVTTIAADGSRNFLRPADVSGKYTLLRRLFGFLAIGTFIALPWIDINGFPAVFIDIPERRFHLFGLTLAAQDTWLFFFLITGLGFFLFFTTALFGRLFCGWTCPHTLFLEHVYRRIERILEGNSTRQKYLDALSWSDPNKLFRRGTKHVLFIIVSVFIVHVFLSYFVSIQGLYAMVTDSPIEHWSVFVFMLVASGVLYFNFSWFREQLCLIVCPYGRLQSALTDDDTYVVGYDEIRGEPRGKPGKEGVGDCINCNRCVQVCPTGIDIRQGYQMECVGCMNCIDACNEIMDKLDRPRGLVSYSPANVRMRQKHRLLRPRIFVYIALMILGLGVMTASISTYSTATLAIARMPGAPFYIREDNLQNQFNVRVINKSSKDQSYRISVSTPGQASTVLGTDELVKLEPMGETVRAVIISVRKEDWQGRFTFDVYLSEEGSQESIVRKSTFVGPEEFN